MPWNFARAARAGRLFFDVTDMAARGGTLDSGLQSAVTVCTGIRTSQRSIWCVVAAAPGRALAYSAGRPDRVFANPAHMG